MLGSVIGNYQIIRKLGEGGMGAVYLGQHQLLGRRAAIKVLLPELSARPDIVSRFFNEARAVTSISDPGIVQVFDFGYHTDGSAFIVMEYLEGEPLDRRLTRLGRLPAAEALRLCRQIASSLAAAHAQHITHRDLKPENIYLVHDSEVASGERSKILDFGIAKLSDEQPGKIKTHTGALMGTPIYMSPEQCRGLAELDHRSDIYSLGCVLFHLLIGRPPFEGEGMGDIIAAHIREPAPAPSSRAPEIAPAVDAVVLRCLAKSPAERYQTMQELSAAIGQILPYLTSPGAPTQWAYGQPPYAGQAPYPAHAGHPSQPYASRPGTPAPPAPRTPVPLPPGAVKPTTLGASNGQVAAASLAPGQPAARSRALGWVIAAVAVLGGAGAAVGVLATRGGTHAAAGGQEGGVVATPGGSDSAQGVTGGASAGSGGPAAGSAGRPAIAIDAGVALAATPDAGAPDAAPDTPIDAAAPVGADAPAVPGGAPARRHRSHSTPRTGSGAATSTPGCDRSVDTDCDGIPDVR